jgi:ABC-type uncharacterized transport system permease subunit
MNFSEVRIFYVWWKRGVIALLRYPSDIFLDFFLLFMLPLVVKIGILAIYNANSSYSFGDTKQIVSYFLIGQVFWSFFSGNGTIANFLAASLKTGEFSFMLLRPGKSFNVVTAKFFAHNIDTQLFAFISLLVGVFISTRFNFSASEYRIITWALFNAGLSCYSLNLLFGGISFRVAESRYIRYTLLHTIEMLRGSFVPLFLFPLGVQSILLHLPTASMFYIPTVLMTGQTISTKYLFFGTLWGVLLMFCGLKFWSTGLKKYEAVGA